MICKSFTLHEIKKVLKLAREFFKLQEIFRKDMGGVSKTDILFVSWKWQERSVPHLHVPYMVCNSFNSTCSFYKFYVVSPVHLMATGSSLLTATLCEYLPWRSLHALMLCLGKGANLRPHFLKPNWGPAFRSVTGA